MAGCPPTGPGPRQPPGELRSGHPLRAVAGEGLIQDRSQGEQIAPLVERAVTKLFWCGIRLSGRWQYIGAPYFVHADNGVEVTEMGQLAFVQPYVSRGNVTVNKAEAVHMFQGPGQPAAELHDFLD
jgi:hypothetical protein